MRNRLRWIAFASLLGACGTGSTGSLDGLYDCTAKAYRAVSCSPQFLDDKYQLRITGLRIELVGHGACVAQRDGDALACRVQQFDPTCSYDFALFRVARLAAGEIEAAIPSDGAADATCVRR